MDHSGQSDDYCNRPNPKLWDLHSERQLYLTAPDDRSPENGPALTFSAILPDLHHYNGRGGRVFFLWADERATNSNINATMLSYLAETYGHDVEPSDLMAYLAALMAHPAFTRRFADDLKQPGLRVPVTADAALFAKAAALGREVVWLHTYGDRFEDAGAKRPKQAPRLDRIHAPTIPVGGAIPGEPEPLADSIDYDPAKRTLTAGKGHIDNVMPEIWAYGVSGKPVVRQWFSYRRRDRSRPIIGDRRPPSPLEYTTELMNLLHVLGRLTLLEPLQAELLEKILEGPLLSVADLALAGDNDVDAKKDSADGAA